LGSYIKFQNDAWGAYSYNEDEDVVRFNITPEFVKENQEVLNYEVSNDGIIIAWEKARIFIPISN